jgi:glycosyltransferase involved in cell wall biosynthesis
VLSVQSGLFVLGCRLDRRVFRRILDCSVTLTFLERETVAVSRWRAAAGRPNISYFPGAIQQAQLDRDASVVRLAASEMVATHYRDRQGLPIHGVLYPGIDAIAAALPRGSRPGLRILFVGRLESNKGIATLLHIAHRLASQAPTGLPEPLELRLAGEGPLRAEVLRSSAALTGTVRLVCLGALSADAVRAELAAADVFVFPSRYETFGIAVLEALAAGVAVVCSDLPALREVAGEAAIFVPPADLDAWVEATRRVLRDPTLRQHLSAQGPIRARRFTWDETVDTLEAHAWRIAPRGEAPA